ncbi:F0F1 ATP synthase subunit epsilon [bacterium]|nr:F0F1 ATP synthase subunit epsilon [bacterium]
MHLKIVTHEKIVYDDVVDEIYSKGTDGEFGVLKDHIPFMSALDVGVTKIVKDGNVKFFTIMGGVFQFAEDEAVILTHSSESGEEVDIDRAKNAKQRAEERLQNKTETIDAQRAEAALARAMARLKAAQTK